MNIVCPAERNVASVGVSHFYWDEVSFPLTNAIDTVLRTGKMQKITSGSYSDIS